VSHHENGGYGHDHGLMLPCGKYCPVHVYLEGQKLGAQQERERIIKSLRDYAAISSPEEALRHPLWTKTFLGRETAEKIADYLVVAGFGNP